MVLVVIGMFALGMVQKVPCYDGALVPGRRPAVHPRLLLRHPAPLRERGFADDLVPYFDRHPRIDHRRGIHYLEYPVLTGLFMEVASWLTPHGGAMQHRAQIYWIVNAGDADALRGRARGAAWPAPTGGGPGTACSSPCPPRSR